MNGQVHTRINTYVRIRPLNDTELVNKAAQPIAVRRITNQTLVFNPARLKSLERKEKFSTTRGRQKYNQLFHFDQVFDPSTEEAEVYAKVASPLIKSVLGGSNASLFAYGATGCGKTYTISNIVHRICDDLFDNVQPCTPGETVSIRLTYLQLYNEKIIDLLPTDDTNYPSRYLELRDTRSDKRSLCVAGLAEHFPRTADEMRALITRGNRNRVIASTHANSKSSRSHAILTIHIDREGATSAATSFLSVIDLAGSERAQGTENRGKRMVEGANINKSLLSLGNCIKARAYKSKFIPYRDSKLTRLLQYSLEGNCNTSMIVCVSPSVINFDETRNTLEYGKRAASIELLREKSLLTDNKMHHQLLVLKHEKNKLSEWKKEVVEYFSKYLPDLREVLELSGGIENISGRAFVSAVVDCAAILNDSSQETKVDMESLTLDHVNGSRQVVSSASEDAKSPLKRARHR